MHYKEPVLTCPFCENTIPLTSIRTPSRFVCSKCGSELSYARRNILLWLLVCAWLAFALGSVLADGVGSLVFGAVLYVPLAIAGVRVLYAVFPPQASMRKLRL